MHLKTRNVNTAFRTMVAGIKSGEIPTCIAASRAGEVAMVDEPVMVTYSHPRERVLLNPARDANPFFHLYEALWMLAGRNDLAPLTYYNSQYARYSDDGVTVSGAYGYRWRKAAGGGGRRYDQLKILIDHLKHNPASRRAVLQMWTVEDDLLKVDTSKDVCCNTCIYFSLEMPEGKYRQDGSLAPTFLNVTVCNRSNDMVWGMLGANYVHFSILQEYVAAHLGVEVGVYNQFTNNLHVYTERWDPEGWLRAVERSHEPAQPFPLVENPQTFDRELTHFVDLHAAAPAKVGKWEEPFLSHVAEPMLQAYHAHKRKAITAISRTGFVAAEDWQMAAQEWLQRRQVGKAAVSTEEAAYDPDLAT